MTIDGKIRDQNLQYDLMEKEQKYQQYSWVKLTNMNILQEKKYYLLTKLKLQTKLNLLILLQEKLLKNK